MRRNETINLRVQDVTGQREINVRDIPADTLWGDALSQIVSGMSLPPNESADQSNIWQGRLEREGRHLNSSEVVGDALRDDDLVVLQPEVMAGAM